MNRLTELENMKVGEEIKQTSQPTVIIDRFILEINTYPNGKKYLRVYPIGQTRKDMSKKKKIKKELPEIIIQEEEIY